VKTRYCRAFFLLSLLSALLCSAQDFEDDSVDLGKLASLSLIFDNAGAAKVDLNLPEVPQSWGPLRAKLGEVLHCSPTQLNSPGSDPFSSKLAANWTEKQRQRYERQMASYNQRRLTGKCESILNRSRSVLEGDIAYAPFAAELASAGIDELQIYVQLPRAPFLEYSPADKEYEWQRSEAYLTYKVPLNPLPSAASIHLAYGFRRVDLYRALGILFGFICLPVSITLWMRRSALLAGRTDPMAAWFSFFRTFNFLVTGSMVLWVTSGLGARQSLYQFVGILNFPEWQQITLHVLISVGPAFLVYLLCIAVSYPVNVRLRGRDVSLREFLSQHATMIGAQAVPLMFFLAGLEIMTQHRQASVILMVVAFIAFQFFRHLKMRVLKVLPQPLTTGELRDRVFALAGRLGVQVSQVFVLPAGKGQVANAFAARNKIVMFTDYLLQHLSKREVDAVAAHELGHLRHKHPVKLTATFFAAMFLPSYFPLVWGILMSPLSMVLGLVRLGYGGDLNLLSKINSGVQAFEKWPQHDFVLVMLGLAGFYFLSRHFEYVADATAVRLTGDPEAQIMGLLKVHHLNRTPIQWSKASGSWLTHPSTVRRAERIAAAGGMSSARVHEILQEYEQQSRSGQRQDPALEHYSIPAASDPERIHSTARKALNTQLRSWLLLCLYVAFPALSLVLIGRLNIPYFYLDFAYLSGLVASAALLNLVSVWLGESVHAGERRRLAERFRREGLPVGGAEDLLVGFAPAPYPRLYGARYHWDGGFLVLAGDRLQFVGEQVKFALAAGEIEGIVIGQGGPSWWKFERIYVRWKSAANPEAGIFNLYLLEPGSMWTRRSRMRQLYNRLQAWRTGSQAEPARAGLAGLESPKIGQVTCVSPKRLGKLGLNLKLLGFPLALAVAAGILFHINTSYLCFAVVILRLIQLVPYWRYRDRTPRFTAAPPLPRAFGAAGLKSS
jgi:Zn-dependent protease with chaperone function